MMKKVICLFFLLSFILFASAEGELKQVKFERGEIITVDLGTKEGIEFNLNGGRHIVNVDKITDKGPELDVFLFVDGDQQINYVTINKEQILKLDLDKDGRGEIYVRLKSLFNDNTDDSGEKDMVTLDFFYPSEEDFDNNQITGAFVQNDVIVNKNGSSKSVISIILLLVILLGVILIVLNLILSKKNKKEK